MCIYIFNNSVNKQGERNRERVSEKEIFYYFRGIYTFAQSMSCTF